MRYDLRDHIEFKKARCLTRIETSFENTEKRKL